MAGAHGPVTKSTIFPKNHFTPPRVAVYKMPNAFRSYGKSMVGYGIASGMFVAYMTDWAWVLRWVPYIGGKYRKD